MLEVRHETDCRRRRQRHLQTLRHARVDRLAVCDIVLDDFAKYVVQRSFNSFMILELTGPSRSPKRRECSEPLDCQRLANDGGKRQPALRAPTAWTACAHSNAGEYHMRLPGRPQDQMRSVTLKRVNALRGRFVASRNSAIRTSCVTRPSTSAFRRGCEFRPWLGDRRIRDAAAIDP